MSDYEVWSTALTVVWIIVTAVGLIAAFNQWRISSMATLLQSEVMLFDGLQRIDGIAADIIALTGQSPKTDEEKKLAEKQMVAADMKHKGAIQNYLNSLDRFCYCVNHGVMPKKNARNEYQTVLDQAVKEYQQYVPEFDKHFPNIIDLRTITNLIQQTRNETS